MEDLIKEMETKMKLLQFTHGKMQGIVAKANVEGMEWQREQWLPFWNKFTAEIKATNLAAMSKFAYLKELLEPKVRMDIDGLPFTTEGYEWAKNILQSG